jgi:hypothetical protein
MRGYLKAQLGNPQGVFSKTPLFVGVRIYDSLLKGNVLLNSHLTTKW